MKAPRVIVSFKNIRVLPSGYQVSVVRRKTEFSKHFAGHSPRSLREANEYRDLLLKTLPSKRRNDIPQHIVTGAGLKQQAVGVYRYASRHFYQVSYTGSRGTVQVKTFPWTDRKSEIEAYRRAVQFRKKFARGRQSRK